MMGRRDRRSWGQRLVIWAGLLIVLAASGGAGVLALVKSQTSQIPRTVLGTALNVEQQNVSGAQNFLLVGIDNALGIDDDSPILIDRDINSLLTDSMIVVRIDSAADRVSMLSVPRDLWVPIAGQGWSDRINTARSRGGPVTLTETLADYLGIPIHHYVEINFAGFLKAVEAIGGVPLNIEQPIRDDSLALRIEQAGEITLDADTALAYVRTRRPLTLREGGDPANENDWVQLGAWNDLERNQRQQEFIVATLQQAVARGIRNPFVLQQVFNDLVDGDNPSITLDERLTIGQIRELGDEFRSFQVDQIEQYMLPVTDTVINEKAVLLLVEDQAQAVLDNFRGSSVAGVRVRVLNGTLSTTVAVGAESDLERTGFSVVERVSADRFDVVNTVILHTEATRDKATTLADYLPAGTALEQVEAISGADVELLIGADYQGIYEEPRDSAS